MRTILAMSLVLALAAPAMAHGDHDESKEVNLTGEVVDLTCFMDHDSKGARHASCARKCIEKGMPVGLLSGDTLYTVIISSHESPNAKLAPLAGKMVTIHGAVTVKNGMHVIDMESVAEVSPKTEK